MNRLNRSRILVSWLVVACALAFGACAKTLELDDHSSDGGRSPNARSLASDNRRDAGKAGADETAGAAGSAGNGFVPAHTSHGGDGADAGGDDSLPVPDTRWTGNPDICPAAKPEHRSACDITEGQVCAYFGDDAKNQSLYSECACRMHCGESAAELRWDCYENVVSGRMDCPPAQPEHGSSCFGLKGYQCYYPTLVTCTCPTDADDSNWRCEDATPPAPKPPPAVDADSRVRDLSDDERQTWCEWYAGAEPGFPEPPELEPNADGFYPDTGCAFNFDFLGCEVIRPTALPVSACVANLALSSCEATVRDLNDCARSATYSAPSPFGCARYLSASGCAGTIVNGGTSTGAGRDSGPASGDANSCLVRVR